MCSYGIRGNVLKWLQFFKGRTHQTRVGEHLSGAVAELVNGVVQGSSIGPLMFLRISTI